MEFVKTLLEQQPMLALFLTITIGYLVSYPFGAAGPILYEGNAHDRTLRPVGHR